MSSSTEPRDGSVNGVIPRQRSATADLPADDDLAHTSATLPSILSSTPARRATPPRRRFRLRPAWLGRPVLIALAFVLAGTGLQVGAWQVRHTPAADNRALTDAAATADLIGDVSNGLSKVFSYAPDSTAATEQAATEILGGNALSQYNGLFAQVKQQAAAQKLTLTTRVVRAGVIRLSGGTAQLLVFMDQVIVRKDKPSGTSAAAQLSVTARLDDGHWRIIDIHAR